MTCADRILELHAEIDRLRKLDPITRDEVDHGTKFLEGAVDALPEIAAVIAAAEDAVHAEQHGLKDEMWEAVCLHLGPALTGLNRVLGDKP